MRNVPYKVVEKIKKPTFYVKELNVAHALCMLGN
jgi:hypothetical protein